MKNLLPHVTENSGNFNTLFVQLSLTDIKRILLATQLFAVQYSGQKLASSLNDEEIASHMQHHEIDCAMVSRFPDTYIKEIFNEIDDRLIDAMRDSELLGVH